MKKQELIDKLNEIIEDMNDTFEVKTGFDIQASIFVHPIRLVNISETRVVVVGGYTNHMEIYDLSDNENDIEFIADKIIEYIKGYESQKLEDCIFIEIPKGSL
jgi:hypothetical protein